jgi:uncharacterized peroxidase-related enzyme
MSWLPVVSDEQASPEVKRIYEYIAKRWSFVPNYFRALGHDKQLLEDQANLFTNAMFDERGLPRPIKEQLAIVVSGINVSSYCLPAHLEILGRMGIDKKTGRKLSLDFRSATVEPKLMKLFEFAEKLTKRPGEIEKSDVDQLREAGWSDVAIFDAVLVTSAYAMANRFSAGLGLVADF